MKLTVIAWGGDNLKLKLELCDHATLQELKRAVACQLVGNNRVDLRTFKVELSLHKKV